MDWRGVRTRIPAVVGDIAVIAAAIVYLATMRSGQVRASSWGIVIGVIVLGAVFASVPRGVVVRRLIFAALGVVAIQWFKFSGRDPQTLRIVEYVLQAFAVLLAVDGFAECLRSPLRKLDRILTERPCGSVALGVAIVFVAAPFTGLMLATSTRNWYGDTMPTVATVVRTATHGNRDLSAYLGAGANGRWKAVGDEPHFVRRLPGHDGLYSAYPAGMDLFAWPGVLIAKAIGADLDDDAVRERIEYRSAAVVGGACLRLFFLVALQIGQPAGAFAASVLLATGSVLPSVLGQWLWQQTGVMVWMLLVLLVEFRPRSWVGVALQGIACAMMLACRPSAALFVLPFGVWVLLRDWKRGLILPMIAGIAYLPFAILYQSLYGTVVGPSGTMTNAESWEFGQHLADVLVSPSRGLLVYQPWIVLVPLLLVRAIRNDGIEADRRSRPVGWLAFFLIVAALNVAMVGSWRMWWGGHSYGSRLLADVVPLAGLALVPVLGWLTRWPIGWALVGVLAVVGFAIHGPALFLGAWEWSFYPNDIDTHIERLGDWSHPPFLHVRSW